NRLLHKRSKTAVNSSESSGIQLKSPDSESLTDDHTEE
ncbi:unnamed protein product, partial [Rotaria magnacalcarata]